MFSMWIPLLTSFQTVLSRLMLAMMDYYRRNGWGLASPVLKAEMDVLYLLYGMLHNACQQIERLYHILGTSKSPIDFLF